MKITFDPDKRMKTLNERALDFEDAAMIFAGDTFEFEDDRNVYGEKRMTCYGYFFGRMVMIGYVERGDTRQIFTMRKANDREQRKFSGKIKPA